MDAVIVARIAKETAIPEASVSATVDLFEKGATGPFIVRYRKEITGGLDETKVRLIQERMDYYREVRDKRAALLKSLEDQGKLTDEIRTRIESCLTKVELDDLHQRFRSRKKTRSSEAMEKGLEPLAEYFWNQDPDAWSVEEHLKVFVDASRELSTPEQALQGVVDIIAEWIGTNFEYRRALREMLERDGYVISNVVPAKVNQKTKYNMYYERRESVTTIPSHRILAIRRGCKEGILISSIEGDHTKALEYLLSSVIKDRESIFAPVLEAAVRESYSRILKPLIETEVRTQLKERADLAAIRVFQENLTNLLLSPPAGPIIAMGLDWGKDEECSVAVVDESGAFLEGGKVRFTRQRKARQSRNENASPDKKETLTGSTASDPVPSAADPIPAIDDAAASEIPKADPSGDSQNTDSSSVATQPGNPVEPSTDEVSPPAETMPPTVDQTATAVDEAPVRTETKQETPAEKDAGESAPSATDSFVAPGATEPASFETKPDAPAESTDSGFMPSSEEESAAADDGASTEPETKQETATPADGPESEPLPDTQTTAPADSESVPTQEETTEPTETSESEKSAPPVEPVPDTAASSKPESNPQDAVLTDKPPIEPLHIPAKDEAAASREDSAQKPEREFESARETLKNLITKHRVRALSIGTGPRARELESVLRRIVAEENLGDILIAAVNDAGIAIYSSSRIAREEFPDWNPSARCAVSLARRLQDPLAELVKIDPKLIGVGQYQHDVDQKELHRKLLRAVQSCVNKVGVNVNTAGESLLRYVSGLNDKIARRITAYRKSKGAFPSRESIPTAVGMDAAVYEQAAAFLRIPDGENLLDRTAVHPESYPIVEKMAASLGIGIGELIRNREKIISLKLEDFVTDTAGIPTLKDIREELLKPGRDPRKTFKLPKFQADVTSMSDLKTGMTLEGIVTNVTNFGAFIDIGVRQDGLVHLSQMSNRFIRDP
ncbi:MAG: helix-hairpin-helix domain-containing protein, partial [Acidobacteria bacterium]|nr:helix-hairpin-helix domain-containing protein [Acidobacteriota bacterium]